MPLPTTGYATATVSNPSSALTDFTLLVDLSTMPASWWSAVDTSDGTKGRAAKDDGTELATDWIDFDNGAQTGWLRVKWSGTLASTGTQVLRIYPPVSANSSNGVSDTYGQYNAYATHWEAYYPLHDLNDRTSNGSHLSATGSPSATSGKLGNCYSLNGSSQYLSRASAVITTEPWSILAWFNADDVTANMEIAGVSNSAAGNNYARVFAAGARSGEPVVTQTQNTTNSDAQSSTSFTASSWFHIAGRSSGATNRTILLNNAGGATNTNNYGVGTVNQTHIGVALRTSPIQYFAGKIDDVQFHSASLSDAWIAEEYGQSNNQASFWGSWSWNAGGGSTLPPRANMLGGFVNMRGGFING